MAKWFKPIVPRKKKLINAKLVESRLRTSLSSFLFDLWQKVATYDAPPSPRYRRTNKLKTSWSKRGPFWRGWDLIGQVVSSGKTAPYNIYVKGPKKEQAKHMARKGWVSISDTIKQMWPPASQKFKRIIMSGGI